MVKDVSEFKVAHMMSLGTNEITTIAAKLLGTLDNVIQQTVRAQGTYKKRQDQPIRKCGGLNVVMCGAFWQPHPV